MTVKLIFKDVELAWSRAEYPQSRSYYGTIWSYSHRPKDCSATPEQWSFPREAEVLAREFPELHSSPTDVAAGATNYHGASPVSRSSVWSTPKWTNLRGSLCSQSRWAKLIPAWAWGPVEGSSSVAGRGSSTGWDEYQRGQVFPGWWALLVFLRWGLVKCPGLWGLWAFRTSLVRTRS